MNKNELNYSDQKNNKKKIVIVVMLLAFAFILTIGTVVAYFSDMSTKSGNISSSTLKINGTHTFYLNGIQTQFENINDIVPGDVIVIKGNITNLGKESAWVRERIAFNTTNEAFLSYIKVYNSEFSQAELLDGSGLDEFEFPLNAEGFAVSGNRVINAGEQSARIDGSGFNFIDSDTYNFSITIYFMHTAPNITQNVTFGFEISTQALQFKNNNADEPNESAWATVE